MISFWCFQAQNNLTICVLDVVIVGFLLLYNHKEQYPRSYFRYYCTTYEDKEYLVIFSLFE